MFDLATRILVVDDMMTMRNIVMKACKTMGFTDIISASDGALGWQALTQSETPVGFIISDWNMPNCTGLELLKRVRGDKRYAHLPFMLVTAEAEQHQILEAVKSGVNAYVVKPFTPDSLKERVEFVHKKLVGAKSA